MRLRRSSYPVRRLLLAVSFLLAVQGCSAVGSRAYFLESDAALRESGRLRTDRGARDVNYSNSDLVEHFLRVAFGEEYTLEDGRYIPIQRRADAPLKRWGGAIRYQVTTDGPRSDTLAVTEFAATLSRISRLDIAPADTAGDVNLFIHFQNASRRAGFEATLQSDPDREPMIELFSAWRDTPEWPCASEFYYQPRGAVEPFQIEFAVIYIRDELTGVSRQSCIEEEMSQALGLARDDPTVRPSIFNDDEEFALLTEHDELLLRILYDPRLTPGLAQVEALPIVQRIVGDLRPWSQ